MNSTSLGGGTHEIFSRNITENLNTTGIKIVYWASSLESTKHIM